MAAFNPPGCVPRRKGPAGVAIRRIGATLANVFFPVFTLSVISMNEFSSNSERIFERRRERYRFRILLFFFFYIATREETLSIRSTIYFRVTSNLLNSR